MFEGYSRHNNVALLGIRVILGVLWLVHGVSKLLNPGGTQELFTMLGFPGVVGLVVGAVELVGGVLLIAGLLTRVALIPLLGVITVAIVLVQLQQPGDLPLGLHTALERDLLYLFGMGVLMSFGPGKYSIDGKYPQVQVIRRLIGEESRKEV
jgi:putative oxidoreductase